MASPNQGHWTVGTDVPADVAEMLADESKQPTGEAEQAALFWQWMDHWGVSFVRHPGEASQPGALLEVVKTNKKLNSGTNDVIRKWADRFWAQRPGGNE